APSPPLPDHQVTDAPSPRYDDITVCKLEYDTDYHGNDIKATDRDSVYDCTKDCQNTPGCKLFTWFNNQCWLKHTEGPKSGAATRVSCVFATQAPTPVTPSPSIDVKPADATDVPSPRYDDITVCKLEYDTDYYGNDIKATDRDSVYDCTADCQNTPGCKLFSWYNNQCWLKHSEGPKSNSPTRISCVFATQAPTPVTAAPSPRYDDITVCKLEYDTDYHGNDIKATDRNSVYDCTADCQNTPGCKLFTWFNNQCWLKSVEGPKSSAATRISCVFPVSATAAPAPAPCHTDAPATSGKTRRPLPSPCDKGELTTTVAPSPRYDDITVCKLEYDTDYYGNDIKATDRDSVYDCTKDCQDTPGCKLFSWYNNQCWLKHSEGPKSTSPTRVSCVFSTQAPTPVTAPPSPRYDDITVCKLEYDTDYHGNDIKATDRDSVYDCTKDCQNTPGCKLFTWFNNQCWLKHTEGPKSGAATRVSCVFATQAPTPVTPSPLIDVKPADATDVPSPRYDDITVCKLEYDTDYFGNDIKATDRDSVYDCTADCQNTPGCKLFSWFDNKCFLKHTEGPKSSSPTRVSCVFATQAPTPVTAAPSPRYDDITVCKLEYDTDYHGNDIKATDRDSVYDCTKDCENTPGCKLFTWFNNQCWLKNTEGLKSTAATRISCVFPVQATTAPAPAPCHLVTPATSKTRRPLPTPCDKSELTTTVAPSPRYDDITVCKLEYDTDYYGNDIKATDRDSVYDCTKDCQETPGCKLFSWFNNQCWLKHSEGPKSDSPTRISCVFATQAPTPATAAPSPRYDDITVCKLEYNTDYHGNDIKATDRNSVYDCTKDCQETPGCKLFTWYNNQCWLKHTEGPKSGADTRISCVFATQAPSPVTASPRYDDITVCKLEYDTDYYGNDIKATDRDSVYDCTKDCQETPGCKLFSWYNNQCWLKHSEGPKSDSPTRISCVFATQAPTPVTSPPSPRYDDITVCKLEYDTDYFGNDIKATDRDSVYDCTADCQNTPGCKLFSWYNNQCWLKHSEGPKSDSPTRISCVFATQAPTPVTHAPAPPPCHLAPPANFTESKTKRVVISHAPPTPTYDITVCKLEYNTDYYGNDIKATDRDSVYDCTRDCQETPGCKLFSWYNNQCWLKHSEGPKSDSPTRISCVFATQAPTPVTSPPSPRYDDITVCKLEYDTDYFGNDIKATDRDSVYDCTADCQNTPGCKLFSWFDNKCFLKHTEGPKSSSPTRVSCVFATQAPT
ncbi:hypothetical protein As57867_003596, partial [Aphanomyces stellatus]